MIDCVSPQALPSSEARLKRRRQSSMASTESPREIGHMRRRHDTGSATFVGSGSGIHFVRTVRQAFTRNSRRPSLNDDSNDDELVPGEDDQQHLPGLLWRSDEVLFPTSGQDHSFPNPTFEDLVRWTKPYFVSWHPFYPFLHAPSVLELLEKLSIHALSGLEHLDVVIIRSIMSISVADRRQTPPEKDCLVPANLLYQSIEEAVSALQSLLIHPSSIPALQAALSIQLFLTSMLRLNTASRIGGMIVRMAYHLGLHRCPSRFPQFSFMEAEIRRRLFWSIYCIERYLAQALGQPLELKDDDLDVCFPDQELHIATDHPDTNQNSSLDSRRLMLSIALAKHGRIKGLILELRNKSILHSRTDPDEIAYIDAEISRWWNDTSELLDPLLVDEPIMGNNHEPASSSTVATPPPLKESHKLLLFVHKHELILLLNRPVITSGYDTPAHASAVQNCIGASKAIISNVYRHINKGMKLEGAQNGRIYDPLVWPGIVWLIWQSGLILLYAAFEGYYAIQTAQRETDCCVAILQNLALRGNFWPSACGAAIKDLQTSLYAKTMHEVDPGHETSDTIPSATSQQTANFWEGVTDSSNTTVPSTGRHRSASRIEGQSHDRDRAFDSENRSNERSDKRAASWYTPQYPQKLDSQRTLSRPGAPPRVELMSSPHPETGANISNTTGQNARDWSIPNGNFDSLGDPFNVFEDVFQLMDMPYTLNDPYSHAQFGMYDAPSYQTNRSANVPAHGFPNNWQ